MTVYIALLAVAIGLMPVLLDKWRASHKPDMNPQRVPRRR
jgi:hypothetical protein